MLKSNGDQEGGDASALSIPEAHPVPGVTLPTCQVWFFLDQIVGKGREGWECEHGSMKVASPEVSYWSM